MWRLVLLFLLSGCVFWNNVDNTDDYLGAEYVGAQYLNDPLGEEHAPDTDPLIRFDAFDCTTFVETALANGDVDKLNKIRYANGTPSFTGRNHFTETDWIKNNSDIVENASAQYAPTAKYTVTIDKKNWFKQTHHMDTSFPKKTVTLEYIPYKYAADIHVEKPVVVLFLRHSPKIREKIGSDLVVRHMGFLLPNGKLRHASSKFGKVVDQDFMEYAQRMMEKQNNLGIMILEIKK